MGQFGDSAQGEALDTANKPGPPPNAPPQRQGQGVCVTLWPWSTHIMYKSGDCRSSRLCNTLALVNTCYVSSSVGQSKFVLPEGEHCNKACQKSNQSQTSPQRQRAPSRREGNGARLGRSVLLGGTE
eukprot:jgi/Botrbrau1/12223/Bobra.0197s0016.1